MAFGSGKEYFLWDFIGQKLVGSEWKNIKTKSSVSNMDVDSSLAMFSNTTPVFSEREIPHIAEIIRIVSSHNGVFSGGAILSALHSESINDIDCYFDNYLDFGKSIAAIDKRFREKFDAATRVKFMLQSSYSNSFLMKNKIACVARIKIFQPVSQNIDFILCTQDKLDVIRNFDLSFCSIWWSSKLGVGAFHLSDTLYKRGRLNSDYFQYLMNGNEFIVGRIKKYISKGYNIDIECNNKVSLTQPLPTVSDSSRLMMTLRKILFNIGIEQLNDVSIYRLLQAQTLQEFIDIIVDFQTKHSRLRRNDSDFNLFQGKLKNMLITTIGWVSTILFSDMYHLHTLFKEPQDIDYRVLLRIMRTVYGIERVSPGFSRDENEQLTPKIIVENWLESEFPEDDNEFDISVSKFDLPAKKYEFIANRVVSDFFEVKKQRYTLQNKAYALSIYKNFDLFGYVVNSVLKNDTENANNFLNTFYTLDIYKTILLSEFDIFDSKCDVPTERYVVTKQQLAALPFKNVLMEKKNAWEFLQEEPDEYGYNIVCINISGNTTTAFGGKSSDFVNVRYDNLFMPCKENVTSTPRSTQVENTLYIRPAIDAFRTCISIDCWRFIKHQILHENQRVFTFNNRKQSSNVSGALTIQMDEDDEGYTLNVFGERVNIVSAIHCSDTIYYYDTVGVVSIE